MNLSDRYFIQASLLYHQLKPIVLGGQSIEGILYRWT